MSKDSYIKLIQLLEEMIVDGVQLVHGGHLMGWSDTVVPRLISEIRQNQAIFRAN